ncbi:MULTISPECIES: phospho-N-acetylmuramoyl-pentapeptide-transferase [unclassified Marinitoga]|uniref:phospho-N-acetylmuramoyl-pentapeptide- transferase n=1 Tax=unclassified Marinitoga TaxID=2640159 RepID=UPI0006411547|nr:MULTISPECIES: phospho-N-acetylmuramoyl-pentapeptide-transferase [unclassified Marinitoga]KLO21428.1 phospho-N-acetylmuramoyl-pentapeptide-transferase [Marinitoga sp. 1155]NUU99790.1 phospho-N-acetylmuramoyl-pentapeptide-transferase [Marinitoga sp. 1154]
MLLSIILILIFMEFLLYPVYIKWAQKKQFGQYIRPEGPDLHGYKQGTPTAGGILFIPTISILNIISYIYYNDLIFMYIAMSAFLFGLIGFFDDFSSILKKDAMGLSPKGKLVLQILFSSLLFIIFFNFNMDYILKIPFTTYNLKLSSIPYLLFYILFFTGFSNATNLTDGLDGLAGGTFIISSIFTILIGVYYFNAPIILLYTIILPVTIFLIFNVKPAKVFMGDTGSLALGAILSALVTYYHIELFLIFTGFIFVIETLSVIIQVFSFKLRGKRVFLMSPIHHHFELKKWPEENITFRFILVNLIFSLIGFGGIL